MTLEDMKIITVSMTRYIRRIILSKYRKQSYDTESFFILLRKDGKNIIVIYVTDTLNVIWT